MTHSVNQVVTPGAHLLKLWPFFRRKDDKCPLGSSLFLRVLTLKTFSSFRPPVPNLPPAPPLTLAGFQMGQPREVQTTASTMQEKHTICFALFPS